MRNEINGKGKGVRGREGGRRGVVRENLKDSKNLRKQSINEPEETSKDLTYSINTS